MIKTSELLVSCLSPPPLLLWQVHASELSPSAALTIDALPAAPRKHLLDSRTGAQRLKQLLTLLQALARERT